MDNDHTDMNTALMVDGNAVAGQLEQIFGRDMTMAIARCAGCARDARMGAEERLQQRGPAALEADDEDGEFGHGSPASL